MRRLAVNKHKKLNNYIKIIDQLEKEREKQVKSVERLTQRVTSRHLLWTLRDDGL